MSRTLAQLIGVTEHSAELATAKLEQLSGYHSEDNRMVSEIKMALRPKIAELGLDPDDTTPKELHHGLLARFEKDSRVFSNIVGSLWHTNPDKFSERIISLIELCDIPKEVWVLKRSVAKDILKIHQPKRLMRKLNYRSVASMLKREDIDELYATLPQLESSAWLRDFYRQHSSLTPADFEIRSVRLLPLPASRWSMSKSSEKVVGVPQLGTVAVWPVVKDYRYQGVKTFIDILNAIESLRVSSLVLMKLQMSAHFGQELARQLESGLRPAMSIGHIPVSWHSIHHYWGHLPSELNPLLEPHFEAVNAHKVNISRIISTLHPSFRWWHDNDFLAAIATGKPVSANLADIAYSFAYKSPYEYRNTGHLHQSVWNELIARYMSHPGVRNHVLNQQFSPETINIPRAKARRQPEAVLM